MFDAATEFTDATRGLRCTEVKLYAADSWSFDFEGRFSLIVQSPWRIVNDRGIALTNEDDGQKFGLPAPINGAIKAMELLSALRLRRVMLMEKTGDIVLEFESDTRLEVFNNSSGYEGWNCGLPSGRQAIGRGGGTIAHLGMSSN